MEQALKFNQWKVALYFEEIEFKGKKWLNDFHFLKEEQDGSWSGKMGYTKFVKEYDFLPETCDNYCHYNTYSITNPHAKVRG